MNIGDYIVSTQSVHRQHIYRNRYSVNVNEDSVYYMIGVTTPRDDPSASSNDWRCIAIGTVVGLDDKVQRHGLICIFVFTAHYVLMLLQQRFYC